MVNILFCDSDNLPEFVVWRLEFMILIQRQMYDIS